MAKEFIMKKITGILFVIIITLLLALGVSAEEGIISDEGRLPFEDVKDNYWFYDSTVFCYTNGIVNGMDKYTFKHTDNLTRAQFVQMIANLENVDTSGYSSSPFQDVWSNYWYYNTVCWGFQAGIVSGTSAKTFNPQKSLTRAELATIMRNYMKDKYTVEIDHDLLLRFTDRPKESYWYYDAMCFAVSAGLISGTSETILDPTGTVTRAQATVIFMNFMENYYYGDCEHSFAEADCDSPELCNGCGMIKSLALGHRLNTYDCVTGGVCTVCGDEVSKSTLIHDFDGATCTEADICNRCGESRGKELGHKWKERTCVAPKTCTRCGLTEGEPTGIHSYSMATCTTPMTCEYCGKTKGSANGHFGGGLICGRCGEYMYTSHFQVIEAHFKRLGSPDPETGAYHYTKSFSNNDVTLYYYLEEKIVVLENVRYLSATEFDAIQVEVIEGADYYEFTYIYGTVDGITFIGTGKLDPSTFTKQTPESFDAYVGELKSYHSTYLNVTLWELLMDLYEPIFSIAGGYIKDIGFTAFKY